jgi:hypothetical protein
MRRRSPPNNEQQQKRDSWDLVWEMFKVKRVQNLEAISRMKQSRKNQPYEARGLRVFFDWGRTCTLFGWEQPT